MSKLQTIEQKPKMPASIESLYSKSWFSKELRDMLVELEQDKTIMSKAQLFRNRKYSSNKFYKKKAKYDDNVNIQELIKKIDEILESRLVEQGLNGKSIPMTIFLLKNYYGYTDKQEIQQDTSVTFKVTRGYMNVDKDKKVIDSTVVKK